MTHRFLAVAALLALASPAFAHPKLVSATPGDAAEVQAPTSVSLRFSEAFMPKLTQIQVFMVSMPGGAAHPPMPMPPAKLEYAPDNKSLTAHFKAPLPAGGYQVEYRTVGADTHRIEGKTSFTVR